MATLDFGNGSDGNVTITTAKNLNTDIVAGSRSYADMVGYNVSAIGINNVTTTATPNGIISGDKVILINIQGDGSSFINVGNYEIFTVDGVVGSTITFTQNKTLYYGSGVSNDTGLGVGWNSGQKVLIQRIPQYNNMTITGAEVTANAYSYAAGTGGVFAIYVSGTLTINGTGGINMTGKGYTPANRAEDDNGSMGSGPLGQGYEITNISCFTTRNSPGGAAGSYNYNGGGGGAGYANAGSNAGPASGNTTLGGTSYGIEDLTELYFGASGGTGGGSKYNGSYGGGIILINSTVITCTNSTSKIVSDGVAGEAYPGSSAAGGGAGGSIRLNIGSITASSQNITGLLGAGGAGFENPPNDIRSGADGSVGRIAIYHPSTFTLTGNETSPTPYVDSTAELPLFISGTITEDATIYIYHNTTGELITSQAVSSPSYEVTNLPTVGPFHVVAIPDSSSKNGAIYRDVLAANT